MKGIKDLPEYKEHQKAIDNYDDFMKTLEAKEGNFETASGEDNEYREINFQKMDSGDWLQRKVLLKNISDKQTVLTKKINELKEETRA